MTISDAQINKFQELYKKQFGRKISKEEALEKGLCLVNLISIIRTDNTKRLETKHE